MAVVKAELITQFEDFFVREKVIFDNIHIIRQPI